jgi:hypothetical protein
MSYINCQFLIGTDRLDVLANQIFDKYNEEFTVGEHVTIKDDREGKKRHVFNFKYNVLCLHISYVFLLNRSKGQIVDVKTSSAPAIKGTKGKSSKAKKSSETTQVTYRVQMLDKQGNPVRQVTKNGSNKYLIKTFIGGDNLRFIILNI